ncbi:aminopeptidase Q [Drosophila bipectinata]|uniref:aminopeptidase Q n=1 Tax=Drosophila bipectinata TaxID=42026 RepID=UPI001C8953FD|nr:aminopeptidase Q [Drosophila bipectinata]
MHPAGLTGWVAMLAVLPLCGGSHRLPTWVVPTQYTLDILVRVDQPYQPFEGAVSIQMQVEKPVKRFQLNSLGLEVKIMGVKLTLKSPVRRVPIESVQFNEKAGQMTITAQVVLSANATYVLSVSFNSVLRKDNVGLFSSSYVDQNTTLTQWMAATYFEPIFARQAFPCFDNPMFRTPFTIRVGHPAQFRALSNMGALGITRHSKLKGYVWTSFASTPPIPTYMVAFSIFQFDVPGSITQQRPESPISIWARPDALAQTAYATQVAPQLFVFYEKLFGIKLYFSKIDLLAVPDADYWARESLGLWTFAESAILFDSQRSTLADQQGVARAVAISVVRQWFGHLVSVTRWQELWLKNAFALYFSTYGVDALTPEWEYKERYGLKLYFGVLETDSYTHTDVVAAPVSSESHIETAFLENGERKAAVLLSMLSHMVGEEAWNAGVKRYLTVNANQSASARDFWEVLQLQWDRDVRLGKGLNITRIMDSWLSYPGYPLLTVTRNYGQKSALVVQQRFHISPQAEQKKEDNKPQQPPCWWIPLTYTCGSCKDKGNSSVPRHWLTCPTSDGSSRPVPAMMRDVVDGPTDWLLLNIRHSSPLRVNYDLRNWELINKTLSSPETLRSIHRVDRAKLVDDILNLAWSGVMDYPTVFGMLGFLEHEDEYVVWDATVTNFERINNVAKRHHSYLIFKTFMRNLVKGQFDKEFGANRTINKEEKVSHRPVILQLACQYELPACLSLARREFAEISAAPWPREGGWMSIREQETVLCTAVRFGTDVDWDVVDGLYQRSNFTAEQESLLSALACSRNIYALERMLKSSFQSDGVRKSKRAFRAIVSNPLGYRIAIDYISENIQLVKNFCNNSTTSVVDLMKPLAENLIMESELQFLEKSLTGQLKDIAGIDEMMKLLLEQGSNNIHWLSSKYEPMLRAIRDISLWKYQS